MENVLCPYLLLDWLTQNRIDLYGVYSYPTAIILSFLDVKKSIPLEKRVTVPANAILGLNNAVDVGVVS